MMGPDGRGGVGHDAAAAAPAPPLLKQLSFGHERALRAEWDAEEQSTLDSVLAKLPVSKHSALERWVFFLLSVLMRERARAKRCR